MFPTLWIGDAPNTKPLCVVFGYTKYSPLVIPNIFFWLTEAIRLVMPSEGAISPEGGVLPPADRQKKKEEKKKVGATAVTHPPKEKNGMYN